MQIPSFRTAMLSVGVILLLASSLIVSACGKSDEDVQAAVDQALAEQKAKDKVEELSEEQARLRREVRKLKRGQSSGSSSSSSSGSSTPRSSSSSSSSSRSDLPEYDGWVAQLGSFRYLSNAQSQRDTLGANGISSRVVRSNLIVEFKPNLWVVYAGPFSSRSEAAAAAANADGKGAPGAFARRATVK